MEFMGISVGILALICKPRSKTHGSAFAPRQSLRTCGCMVFAIQSVAMPTKQAPPRPGGAHRVDA
jgi:hypothetical protein